MFMFFHIFVFDFILARDVYAAHLRLELGLCLLCVSTIHSKTDLAMLLTRFSSKWQLFTFRSTLIQLFSNIHIPIPPAT